MNVIHTIRLNGFWTADDSQKPPSYTRRFGMPRMSVAGESAWLVLHGQPEEIVLNSQTMPFSTVGDGVELPLGMLPARNTLTVRAETEPSAIIEIRTGVRS